MANMNKLDPVAKAEFEEHAAEAQRTFGSTASWYAKVQYTRVIEYFKLTVPAYEINMTDFFATDYDVEGDLVSLTIT